MTRSFVTPSVVIDGYSLPPSWSGGTIPVIAGNHQLHMHARWMWMYGQADLMVTTHPGQVQEVFYAPPLIRFSRGDLGLTPQRRRGRLLFAFLIGIPLVLLITAAIVGLANGWT